MKFRILAALLLIILPLKAFSQSTSTDSTLKCISQRMLELQRSDTSPQPSVTFTISENGRAITHNVSTTEQLTYVKDTNQFYWSQGTSPSRKVFFDSAIPYCLDTDHSQPVSHNGRPAEPTKIFIPTSMRAIIKDFQSLGSAKIIEKVNECRSILTFREQLSLPMNALEISTCQRSLENIKKLQTCNEKKNCPAVYSEISAQPPSRYSFVSLFESGISMTDPQKRIGVVMAADTGASWSANALLIANRGKIAAVAGKVGLRFTTVFALFNALSSLTKPIWLAVLDYDDCGEMGFSANQDKTITDCIGQKSHALQQVFSDEILKAIETPNNFFDTVGKQTDGRVGRIACYVFESMFNQWQSSFSEFNNPSCQGRTLSFATGSNYLIAPDSHLYRHINMERTLHFYENSLTLIENRNTGERKPIVSINDYNNPPTRESRSQGAGEGPPLELVPQAVIQEETMIQAILPNIKNMFENGICKEVPGTHESPVHQ